MRRPDWIKAEPRGETQFSIFARWTTAEGHQYSSWDEVSKLWCPLTPDARPRRYTAEHGHAITAALRLFYGFDATAGEVAPPPEPPRQQELIST